MNERYRVYLGDGVYASFDGTHVVLKANSFDNPTDTIYLDVDVLKKVITYAMNLDKMSVSEVLQ